MKKPRLPLLVRVVVALALMGLLPLAISFFQLKSNKDALFDQVVRTHVVASLAAAAQVDTYLEGLITLARSIASHPVLLQSPRSATAQELLAGTLQAQPAVVVASVVNAAGEDVVTVRRRDMKDEIGTLKPADDPRELMVLQGATERWLRILVPLPGDAGQLVLLAEAESLNARVQAYEIGEEALLALSNREGDLLFGANNVTFDVFPATVLEQARSGKLGSGAGLFSDPRSGEAIVGHAELESAPWFVLSRQPASAARMAQERIRQVTWLAALGAILLTAVLSGGAWLTVVKPIRRLAAAQSRLVGADADAGGSEIAQLEASFEILQQRIRDSEDLGKVFLGRYEVTGLIGSGAMGSVFQGWDPKLRRDLALKTVRVNAEDVDQQKLIAGLMDEAAISARIHHPNIVTVYDVLDEGNAAFIAMEFIDGVNLERYLKRTGPLDPDEVIPLAAAIARALAAAHEHELVHHDVKPANVLLGRDSSIKVTDFGISELISSASRSEDVICGTPGYIAPECFLGEAYTPKADLFALGLIIYESLAGKHPFQGRTLRETILNTATVDPEPIETLRSDVPPELAELTARLMAKESADRPSDAASVAAELAELARQRNLEWSLADFEAGTEAPGAERAVERTQLITMSEQRQPEDGQLGRRGRAESSSLDDS